MLTPREEFDAAFADARKRTLRYASKEQFEKLIAFAEQEKKRIQ